MDAMPPMTALWLCRFAQTSAAVLLAGTAALRLLAWGTGAGNIAGWRWLVVGSWVALAVAAGCQLGLTATEMSGLPWTQACSWEVLGSVLGSTRFGTVFLVRVAVLVTLGAGWMVVRRQREEFSDERKIVADVLAAGLSAVLLATLVWAGHAGAGDRHGFLLTADVAHAVAAGAWPGGLVPLTLLLARVRREANPGSAAMVVTRRFSRMSVAAVSVLALSGSFNTWEMVGSWSGLWTSGYGRLVLAKLGLFAGMIALGTTNRRLVCGPGEKAAATLQRLGRNVLLESALAVLVLLATEALAMSAPPLAG